MGFTKRIWKMRGGPIVESKEQSAYFSAREKWRETEQEAAAEPPAEERFAAKYYSGTFDEELNKLAVDTTTLWQGYYPSLYNPHTQEAAEHLPAQGHLIIDPITGEFVVDEPPPEPEPEPPVPAAPVKVKYGKGKAKRRGDEWYPGIYGYPEPGSTEAKHAIARANAATLAAAGIGNANAATGAPKPEVNPDGELIPWQYSNWVISMGQWRGA